MQMWAAVVFWCALWHPVCSGLVSICLQELTEEVVGSPIPEPRQRSRLFRSHSESSDELSELDLSHGKKDAFVLEVCIYKKKPIYMQLFPWTSVTICSHFHRLMILMLWRTFTPSSLMPLPPQVYSIYSLRSNDYALHMLKSVIFWLGRGSYKCHYVSASSSVLPFPLSYLQVSTAATLRSCLGFTAGRQEFRLLFIIKCYFLHSLQQTFCFLHQTQFWGVFFMHVLCATVHTWYFLTSRGICISSISTIWT